MSKPSPFASKAPPFASKTTNVKVSPFVSINKSSPFVSKTKIAPLAASSSNASSSSTVSNTASSSTVSNASSSSNVSSVPVKPVRNVIINRKKIVAPIIYFSDCKTIADILTLVKEQKTADDLIDALFQLDTVTSDNDFKEAFEALTKVLLPELLPQIDSIDLQSLIELFIIMSILIVKLKIRRSIQIADGNIIKTVWDKLYQIFTRSIHSIHNKESLKLNNIVDLIYAWSNVNYTNLLVFQPDQEIMDFLYQEFKKFRRFLILEHIPLVLFSWAKLRYPLEKDMLESLVEGIESNYKNLKLADIADILISLRIYKYIPSSNLMAKFFQVIKISDEILHPYQVADILNISYGFNYQPSINIIDKMLAMLLEPDAIMDPQDIVILLNTLVNLKYGLAENINKYKLLTFWAKNLTTYRFHIYWFEIFHILTALYYWDIPYRPIMDLATDIIINNIKLYSDKLDKHRKYYLFELTEFLRYYSELAVVEDELFRLLIAEIMRKYQDLTREDVKDVLKALDISHYDVEPEIIELLNQKLEELELSQKIEKIKL